MSSVDISEIYEKLLQIYETRYDYANPKSVLSYEIFLLEREGKTREDAILTLYEEEGELTREEKEKITEVTMKKKEKDVERLTTLFSKGEISEESYKRAIEPIEKDIDKLRKEITLPSRPSHPTYEEEPTSLWYLLRYLWYLVPLFFGLIGVLFFGLIGGIYFGLIGGIIAYHIVKEDDEKMAMNLLWEGIAITFLVYVLFYSAFWP